MSAKSLQPIGTGLPARNGAHRDLVVVGTSAGGVEALKTLLASLPADFPAAVIIVQHISPHGKSALATILGRSSTIPISPAHHGDPIRCGQAYLAVPDYHLIVRNERIELGHGPRENGSRPAIDVLFRSAAANYGPRVIGVLLTGSLDDGTAGFAAIKQRFGTTVAQNPAEALFPSMPQSAIDHSVVDHVTCLEEMPNLLERLVQEHLARVPLGPVPAAMQEEIDAAGRAIGSHPEGAVGAPSRFGCPDCGGPLNRIHDGDVVRYRCHVGHAWSTDALGAVQRTKVEDALWTAIRWLDEEESLSQYGAERARKRGNARVATLFQTRAESARQRSSLLREFLENTDPLPGVDDVPAPEPAKPSQSGSPGKALPGSRREDRSNVRSPSRGGDDL